MSFEHDEPLQEQEHTHPHEHHHEHEHEHTHEHPHDHEHPACQGNCPDCEGCSDTPVEELIALVKYMLGHNAAHNKELLDLAGNLREAGKNTAFEQVTLAAAAFEKGNLCLAAALRDLEAE